jgi:hypothetical protein
MLYKMYVIPNTLLKVLLNTNKTGHHVIRYTWHIGLTTLFNNVSGITYDMLASFIGINTNQQYFSYDV